jgi:class 3 adenylate cyclase
MRSHDDKGASAFVGAEQCGAVRSYFLRNAARHPGRLVAAVLSGFAVGVAYRFLLDPVGERDLANFVRSGIQGVGVALGILAVQAGFASGARSRLGAALRRLPLAGEVVVRALVMAAAMIVIGLTLQFLLYWEPYRLAWLTRQWLAVTLPRIVLIGFGLSLVFGVVVETRRLIGGELLASALLGAYHRPTRRQLIVMFLDLAHSTRLAEAMGELKVHDLVTRFFYDIDQPISDFGGAVHAYVGDEVIVSWPVSDDPALNARSVACFFAIEGRIASLAPDYEAEFGVAPAFRAGLHTGTVVVSECGDVKRQLAYFGDTMNVGARLCEYCKTINQHLVVSGDLLRLIGVIDHWAVGKGELIIVRGRQERVEAHVVEEREPCPESALASESSTPS